MGLRVRGRWPRPSSRLPTQSPRGPPPSLLLTRGRRLSPRPPRPRGARQSRQETERGPAAHSPARVGSGRTASRAGRAPTGPRCGLRGPLGPPRGSPLTAGRAGTPPFLTRVQPRRTGPRAPTLLTRRPRENTSEARPGLPGAPRRAGGGMRRAALGPSSQSSPPRRPARASASAHPSLRHWPQPAPTDNASFPQPPAGSQVPHIWGPCPGPRGGRQG